MTRMLPNAWALAIRGSLMYLTAFSFFAVQADSRESHAQVISPTSNAPTPIIQEETSVTPVFDPANLEPLIDTEDPLLMSFSDRLVMPDTTIEMVDFRDQDLGAAMRLFSEQSGINIVPSTDANKVKVNLFLRDVKAMDVLENLTKTHDLYYRTDEKSGVIRIHTTEEYEENLASFRDEQTKVFTLLYPNPVDAAVAIRDLFGDRVVLNFGVGDQDSVLDLVHRLNRFDLVDSRNLGLGSSPEQSSRCSNR